MWPEQGSVCLSIALSAKGIAKKMFGKVVGLGKVSMTKVELSRRNQQFP